MIDSLEKLKSPTAAEFKSTGVLLDSASSAMMGWMHSYDMQMEGKTLEEKRPTSKRKRRRS